MQSSPEPALVRQDCAHRYLVLAFWTRRYQSKRADNDALATMIYRFQDFELDEARLELRRSGVDIAIQARVLRALIYLVRHRDRVVLKDELCDAVWQDIVVSDAALAQVIMHVRKALGDEGEQQSLLKTVRGRGFRFIADVSELATTVAVPASPPRCAATTAQHAVIGRSSELQHLLSGCDTARQGRGLCMLVGGEPGIGKSSLVEALAAEASARGLAVLWGRAWEDGGAPPFWPFIQVLRSLVERHGLEHLQHLSGPGWHELAALLAEALDGAEPAGPRAPARESATNRLRLFDALARLLRALGAGQHRAAQLIIVEDLHACDEASLHMLRFLSRELAGSPLLIVGTFRDLSLAQLPALRALVDSVPATARLQLSALQPQDSALVLARNLSEPPSERLAACVYDLSGGNPLCIAELARHITHGNLPLLSEASSLDNAVPERISQAVRLQLSALPEDSVLALKCASALGRSFAQPLLAQLLELSELQLLEQLAPALGCGILRASSACASQLCFAHALVRNAVYAELASHRRSQLHLQIAQLLEQRADPALVPLHELAHHYHLAASSGGRPKAIEYAVRAAMHAAEMRAFETAAELHERAFALSNIEGVPFYDLLLRTFCAGAACYAAGQLQQAVYYYDRAAEIARNHHAHQAVAEAVGAACYVLRGTIMFDRARQRQLREALRALPEGDSGIKAMLLPAATMGEHAAGALAQRKAAVHAGIAMARRLHEPTVLGQTLNTSHHALWGAAHPSELLELANELIAQARATGDSEMLLDGLVWRVSDSLELGDCETAESDCTEYLSLLEGHHSGWHRYMAAILQHVQLTCHGDLAGAQKLSKLAAELGVRQHEPSARSFFAVRSLFHWLDGYSDDAPGCDLDPPADLPVEYHAFWVLAWARSGRERQARAALATARARGFASLPLNPLLRSTLAIYGLCAIELAELESAAELYDLLLQHDGLHLLLQPGVYLGPSAYYLGKIADKLDRTHAAAQHFESAMRACLAMRGRACLWKVQQSYAQLLIQQARCGLGHPLEDTRSPQLHAEQLLIQASQLSEELDCTPWQRKTAALQEELQRLPPRLTQVAG